MMIDTTLGFGSRKLQLFSIMIKIIRFLKKLIKLITFLKNLR